MPDFGGEVGASGIPSFSFTSPTDIGRFVNLSGLTDARLRALVGSTVLGAAASAEIARRAAVRPPPPPVPFMRPQLGPAIPGGERPPPPVLTPGVREPTLELPPPTAPPPGAMPPFRGLGGQPPGPAPAPAETTFIAPAAMDGITQIQFGDGSRILPLPIPLGSTREFVQEQRGPTRGGVPSFAQGATADPSLAVLREAGLAVPGVSRVGLFQRVLNLARARRILLAINCAEALSGLDKVRRGERLTIQELAPLVGVVLAVLGSEAATEGAITPELLQVALAGCAAGRDAVLIVQTAEQVIPAVRERLERIFRRQPTQDQVVSRARNQDDCQAACDQLDDREEISRCREACIERFGQFTLRQGEPKMPFAIQNGRIMDRPMMGRPQNNFPDCLQACVQLGGSDSDLSTCTRLCIQEHEPEFGDCVSNCRQAGFDSIAEGDCISNCEQSRARPTERGAGDCDDCFRLTETLMRCQRDCGQPRLTAQMGGRPLMLPGPQGRAMPVSVMA